MFAKLRGDELLSCCRREREGFILFRREKICFRFEKQVSCLSVRSGPVEFVRRGVKNSSSLRPVFFEEEVVTPQEFKHRKMVGVCRRKHCCLWGGKTPFGGERWFCKKVGRELLLGNRPTYFGGAKQCLWRNLLYTVGEDFS